MNSDSAFSNTEIELFLESTNLNVTNCVIPIEFIENYNYNIDEVFGNRFFTILFINFGMEIGHFVLLSHLTDSKGNEFLEYFDSTGSKVPEIVKKLGQVNNLPIRFNTQKLQKEGTFTCPKWVISRIYSLPTSLEKYTKIFTSNDKFSPDEIVDILYILKK